MKACEKLSLLTELSGSPKLRNKGIGACLEKPETAGDNKERHKKQWIASSGCGREKKKCAAGVKNQAEDKTGLIAKAAHHKSRGNREDKVSEIESRLDETRLKARNLERLHELADENIVQVIGYRPKEEQTSYKKECELPLARDQALAVRP